LKVIDVEALVHSRLSESPYPYTVIEGSFRSEADSELLSAEFLTDGYKYDVRLANEEGKKQYRAHNYQLLDYGRPCDDHMSRLTPRWRELVEDVCSQEYRAAIATCSRVDLTGAALDVRLVRYGNNDWIEPHVDRKDKLVTHLFYLNAFWPEEWSGALRILSGPGIDDYARQIFPHAGVSVVMVRTDNSWHAVPPVASDAGDSRKVFLVHFVRP